jgi:hypothetical protein
MKEAKKIHFPLDEMLWKSKGTPHGRNVRHLVHSTFTRLFHSFEIQKFFLFPFYMHAMKCALWTKFQSYKNSKQSIKDQTLMCWIPLRYSLKWRLPLVTDVNDAIIKFRVEWKEKMRLKACRELMRDFKLKSASTTLGVSKILHEV